MTARARWGFRARLTALIAGVLILGGGVLLTVQYVLVQQLFASGIAAVSSGCVDDEGAWVVFGDDPIDIPDPCEGGWNDILIASGDPGTVQEVTIQQTVLLSEEVLSGLIVWSVVVLAAFAVLAVLAARWLAGRALGRIGRITRATRELTHDELHRRLDLAGPDDEIKELGDTIDGMLDRLDEAFTRQERFVAAASHELRTPLTATRAALEIPLEQGRFSPEVEPEVRRALAATARSERLIRALLLLARSGRTPDAAALEPVALAAAVRESLDAHRAEAEARGIRVEVAGEASAVGDPTLLGIAVGNLVENAIRHGRDGGTVRVSLERGEPGTLLVVENAGRAVTAEEAARLVEPFNRGDRTRLSGPGTGLGLTLVDTIARGLDGSLALEPRPGGGLIARLALP